MIFNSILTSIATWAEKIIYISLHTASDLHEVTSFNSGSAKNYSDTDAAAAGAAAAAAVFFIPGVAAWGSSICVGIYLFDPE